MKFVSLFMAFASLAPAGGVWRQDPQHPQLEYQVSCEGGDALLILWRNGYPGTVTLKAQIKSLTYNGMEDAKVPAGGTFKSQPETMSCSLGSLTVKVTKFSMAAPPAQPAPKPVIAAAVPKEAPVAEPAPTLIRFDPHAEKLPEITLDKLALISTGMKRAEVLAKLGPPASKLSIDNDESYQYRLGENKICIVRLSNGAVTEITSPQD
jgi:hypothetical protein